MDNSMNADVSNFNNNNNAADPMKPSVPSKPSHLENRNKHGQRTVTAGCITPRSWQPQKFTFGAPNEERLSSGMRRKESDAQFHQPTSWRPVPKVVTKSRVPSGESNHNTGNTNFRSRSNPVKDFHVQKKQYERHDHVTERKQERQVRNFHPHSRNTHEDDSQGFGDLQRMWSKKTKNVYVQNHQHVEPSRTKHEQSSQIPKSTSFENAGSVSSRSSSRSSTPQSVGRSPSTSSNCSVHTASVKRKSGTWHYVKATSPTGTLTREESVGNSVIPDRGKRIDASLQSPRPFRGYSIDEEPKHFPENTFVPKQTSPTSHKNELSCVTESEVQFPREIENHRKEDDPASVEMYEALHQYRISSPESTPDETDSSVYTYGRGDRIPRLHNGKQTQNVMDDRRTVMLQRGRAIDLEGATVHESSTDYNDNTYKRGEMDSKEEQPPPLLPREKISSPRSSNVPTIGTYVASEGHRYHAQYQSQKYKPSGAYDYGDMTPDSNVPPPLLPRLPDPPIQDYTPMSGSTSKKKSMGSMASLGSLNSPTEFDFKQTTNYEPMVPHEEQGKCEYSAAVEPPKRTMSIREYHEIDPDPDAPLTVMPVEPASVPPPPDSVPPGLPVGTRQPPSSPPPLPPMNPDQKGKKLNYVEVEVGPAPGKKVVDRPKPHPKTNYTEVVIGGANVKDASNDQKKGKSVKKTILSIFGIDGYSSEGDAISESSSKHTDEATTDFNKERNKAKRLSERFMRKKKAKSRDENSIQNSRISSDLNTSTTSDVAVGVYGSATNLSTTSSESSRSLSQVTSTSNSNTSSGDGQAVPYDKNRQLTYADANGFKKTVTEKFDHQKAVRRLSHEPQAAQKTSPLNKKSFSEQQLHTRQEDMISQRSHLHPGGSPAAHTRSAENTPSHGYGKSSPNMSGQRLRSRLHQQGSPRPVSEPPIAVMPTQSRTKLAYSISGSSDIPPPPLHQPPVPNTRVLPLTLNINPVREEGNGQLSPNFPSDTPPAPPSAGSVPERPPKRYGKIDFRQSLVPPAPSELEGPPAPQRDLKPDRFRKIHSEDGSTTYSHAEDVPAVHVTGGTSGDPVYDIVPHDIVADLNKSKLLESEPLYQVYRSRTLSHASMRVKNREASQRQRAKSTAPPSLILKSNVHRFSAEIWQSELMTEDAGSSTLWREIPEVIKSGVGKNLTNDQMKLQQAQFEVVTSQASYMRSLNILVDHFMRDWAMESTDILPKSKRKQLFSNIEAVREVEQRFLQDIEQHFWKKLYLTDVARITAEYAKSEFEVYVRYVQNQVYQERVMNEMQRTNDKFAIELSRLESSPFCNKLPLLSFLLLPMQRVTRLPLLISAVVNQADSAGDTNAYNVAKQALAVVNKLVKKCNEGARKMQQTEQLAEIASELAFASRVKTYALVSQSRALVKKGDMTVTITQENKRPKVTKLYLFLFTDVLLFARKKNFLEAGSNLKYEVVDWAKRAMLFVNERAVSENEVFLVLLENCFGKRVEMTLTPTSQNELSRWADALNPQKAEESGDSIYESWDCPQYQCVIPYTAQQPDELTLDAYDVMRVLRKTTDGWLEGERLGDNEVGWFPAENCEEIEDEHVRARNLRNLYRIIP